MQLSFFKCSGVKGFREKLLPQQSLLGSVDPPCSTRAPPQEKADVIGLSGHLGKKGWALGRGRRDRSRESLHLFASLLKASCS